MGKHEPTKCKHEACHCIVTSDEFDGYCSAHCQDAKDLTELRCECGHASCANG